MTGRGWSLFVIAGISWDSVVYEYISSCWAVDRVFNTASVFDDVVYWSFIIIGLDSFFVENTVVLENLVLDMVVWSSSEIDINICSDWIVDIVAFFSD